MEEERFLRRYQSLARRYGIRVDDAMDHFDEFLYVLNEEYGDNAINNDFNYATRRAFEAMVEVYYPDRGHFN